MKINYRPHGHDTEKAGAAAVAPRRLSQCDRLLQPYAHAVMGLTDDQAADAAGMLGSNSYTKRASDLRNLGYIAPMKIAGVEVTRTGLSGVKRLVCWITDEGEQRLQSLE